MRFFIKIIYLISGITAIGFILWYGMPNIRQAFEPVEIISITISLNNKCPVQDDSFIVTVPGTDIQVPFNSGIARLRLKSDRKVQLQANPKYKAISYEGIHVAVSPKMVLEADCSSSRRLKGIFGSMKDQFKK